MKNLKYNILLHENPLVEKACEVFGLSGFREVKGLGERVLSAKPNDCKMPNEYLNKYSKLILKPNECVTTDKAVERLKGVTGVEKARAEKGVKLMIENGYLISLMPEFNMIFLPNFVCNLKN